MTCFSIHKNLRLLLILLLIGTTTGGYNASSYAGNTQSAQETTDGDAPDDTDAEAEDGDKDVKASNVPKAGSAAALRELQRVDSPIVVELYTASDCTSCIFADRMLYDASQEKNVIALSCHITDLDSVDKNGKPQGVAKPGPMDPCVFRQWTYSAKQIMSNPEEVSMKIPTFIFNGDDRLGAHDMDYFPAALNAYRYAPKNRTLEALVRWKDNDTLSIMLPEGVKRRKKQVINASVWLVRYRDMKVEKINEGVNKGRVLRFSNIISDIKHIGKWHGAVRTIEVDVPTPLGGKDRGGYVVLVGEMLGERIMVAGKVSDYPMASDLNKPAPAPAPKAAAPKPAPDVPPAPPPAQ